MSNIDAINEAAEKYAKQYKTQASSEGLENIAEDFKTGALSDAAKQYWFAQFKAEQNKGFETIGHFEYDFEKETSRFISAEQKPVSDEEIEKLAEKEYPEPEWDGRLPRMDLILNNRSRKDFIRGFKSTLQTNVGFGEDVLKLLQDEYDKLSNADPSSMSSHENWLRVTRKGRCHLSIKLITELINNKNK